MDEVAEVESTQKIQPDLGNKITAEENNYRQNLRDNVKEYGFALGVAKAIDSSGGKLIKVKGSEQTQEVLNKEPVLLLVPHNYGYEVFSAIGGLPENSKAENFRMVKLLSEAAEETSWLKNHVIPLYNVSLEKPKRFLTKINRWIQPPKEIDKVQATQLNARSLRSAGEIVANGGLVTVCPEGTRSKNEKWQNGVAAVVKVAKNQLAFKNKEGYIVMCDVGGVSLKNYLIDRASNYLTKLSPYKNIKVKYSEPIPMSEINTDLPGDEIVNQLENRYKNWQTNKAS